MKMNEICQNFGYKMLNAKAGSGKLEVFLLSGIVNAKYSLCICHICI